VLDHESDTHLYVQVADVIRQRVLAGHLSPGDAVPSETELRSAFGIARTTARRAIRMLRDEGLVHTAQGEGTFVGPPGEARRKPQKTPLYQKIADELADHIKRGELKPRRPVPSESTLIQQHSVARETVRRAIRLLREQGWVYTVSQRGTYVSPPEEWPDAAEADT
jgi:DNA-binding GntR family transcriptional regulator